MEKKSKQNNYEDNITDEAHSKLLSFFVEEIKDIYWAEKHLVKFLPRIQMSVANKELLDAFDYHAQQTKEQVIRLEQVFEVLEIKPQTKKCEAMEGLVKEAESIVAQTNNNSATRDVGLIMAAQKIEHYKIATYGSLVQLADMLELDRIVDILKITLDEEKQADKKLTELAESKVNRMSLEEVESH